jgi:hypothetical protein
MKSPMKWWKPQRAYGMKKQITSHNGFVRRYIFAPALSGCDLRWRMLALDNSGHCRILLYKSVVGDALARFVGNETAVRFNASRQ